MKYSRVSDGVMIARGDMGVEIPYEDVPVIQKMITKEGGKGRKKMTITCNTDVGINDEKIPDLEAGRRLADVANAVFDGTEP